MARLRVCGRSVAPLGRAARLRFLRLLGTWFIALGVLLGVMLSSRSAHAFPWIIREGYNTCNTCHADPSGAGILTQYGRGMEEVVVRTPYKGKIEDPGTLGNFAFGVKLPEQLLLQTDYRSVLLETGSSGSGYQNPRYIIMQADQSGQLKLGRFRLNGSIGYNRDNGALSASVTQPADWGAVIARQYWMGFDIGKDEEFLLRIGRMNVPFGLRSIEHTLWARVATRSDVNKYQEHGVTLSYTGEHFRGEVMAILGNYQIHGATNWDGPHERGYAGYLEWLATEKVGLGVTSQITHADEARTDLSGAELNPAIQPGPVWRQAHGITARVSPVKPLVLLAEVDALLNSQLDLVTNAAHNHFGAVGYLQADVEVFQGIHIVGTGEFYEPSFDQVMTSVGGWLGLWWFFAPHFDFRFDWVQQAQGGASSYTDVTSFLFQFHGYL